MHFNIIRMFPLGLTTNSPKFQLIKRYHLECKIVVSTMEAQKHDIGLAYYHYFCVLCATDGNGLCGFRYKILPNYMLEPAPSTHIVEERARRGIMKIHIMNLAIQQKSNRIL